VLRCYANTYPFGWPGGGRTGLANWIYATHERGFALLSMRGPRISRVPQCRPDEDLTQRLDDRIWEECSAA
jgi:p-hydroxybenzoate 3-monooxygenase